MKSKTKKVFLMLLTFLLMLTPLSSIKAEKEKTGPVFKGQGDVEIIFKDTFNKAYKDGSWVLEDEEGNVVERFVADGNKTDFIINLDKGNYVFKMEKAPTGYKFDDKVQELIIGDYGQSSALISFQPKLEKVPSEPTPPPTPPEKETSHQTGDTISSVFMILLISTVSTGVFRKIKNK